MNVRKGSEKHFCAKKKKKYTFFGRHYAVICEDNSLKAQFSGFSVKIQVHKPLDRDQELMSICQHITRFMTNISHLLQI